MSDLHRACRRLAGAVIAACALAGAPAATAQPSGDLARFAAFDETSRMVIDYTVWTEILNGMVFDVGHSNRRPPLGRVRVTGSLISPETNSRYRHETNRVVYHLMDDEYRELLSAYRAELEALPAQLALSSLNPNEQLAYWLNLHNVVVIDELARRYPVRRLDTLRIEGEPFYDAKLIHVDGVRLSLNDIRLRIVGEGWSDPLVIYGFYSGAIGGPTLRNEAFSGARSGTSCASTPVNSSMDCAASTPITGARRSRRSMPSTAPCFPPGRKTFTAIWPALRNRPLMIWRRSTASRHGSIMTGISPISPMAVPDAAVALTSVR